MPYGVAKKFKKRRLLLLEPGELREETPEGEPIGNSGQTKFGFYS